MKQFKKTILLSVLMSMVGANALAYDIAVDNADGVTIYYNYINDAKELEVTYDKHWAYSGVVVIPDEVNFMNRTRKVTMIGEEAFFDCEGLTSVTIGNNVKGIGHSAFYDCRRLKSITFPNSVINIGNEAFNGCI